MASRQSQLHSYQFTVPRAVSALAARVRRPGRPWTVCSTQVRQANGALDAQAVLLVGERPARGRTLGEREAFFVRGGGSEYMIWNAHKYKVSDADAKIVHDALVVR